MDFRKAEFIKSAADPSGFLRDGLPQAAFAGRSNVGKSSVINSVVQRKNFARVGSTPGKTAQVNYFLIDKKFYIVDLPGYGYAAVSKAERDRWGRLMESYFASGLVGDPRKRGPHPRDTGHLRGHAAPGLLRRDGGGAGGAPHRAGVGTGPLTEDYGKCSEKS